MWAGRSPRRSPAARPRRRNDPPPVWPFGAGPVTEPAQRPPTDDQLDELVRLLIPRLDALAARWAAANAYLDPHRTSPSSRTSPARKPDRAK